MAAELRLSVLDQSPIADGCTGSQALRDTLELARLADERGYHRYWVAEHHGGSLLAGRSPEALIGPIAATTTRLRVGSGGVMLPHYSPYKVAETFSTLSGLFPGRIDLGIGRTDGTDDPVTAFALQRDRNHPAPDDFPEQLTELLAYIDEAFPAEHLFAPLAPVLPGRPESPEPWLLGSSAQSAVWAAQLGLPYAFGDFINPGAGVDIVNLYRERFAASQRLSEPRVAVAVRALCARSDDDADRIVSGFAERRTRTGASPRPRRKRIVRGTATTVCARLEQLARDYGAEELIVVAASHEHAARLRSYELLAEVFAGAGHPS